MHEWALAEGVIATSLQAIKGGKTIRRITVVLGELQQIDEKIFRAALRELAKKTAASRAEIVLKHEMARMKCRSCGNEWNYHPRGRRAESIHFLPEAIHAYHRCPSCGSPDFSVEAGRGVWIESIEVE
ncbi:MAG: hydrogenase nickel incorporation protein HypA [Candidatus Hadarchaeales archaeon]